MLKKSVFTLNSTILFVIMIALILACTTVVESDQKKTLINSDIRYNSGLGEEQTDLTPEQEDAFDAFNEIQIKGDHLYSTFAGIQHKCLPADTSFTISQAELLIVLEDLLANYYKGIPEAEQKILTGKAVKAQKEYLVLRCYGSVKDSIIKRPTTGTWILPQVLNERDVIIKW